MLICLNICEKRLFVVLKNNSLYYNTDLSKDLARMLPFTLAGVYIIDQSYFEIVCNIFHIERSDKIFKPLNRNKEGIS